MYSYPCTIATLSALLLSTPRSSRPVMEAWITEEVHWMVQNGWRLDYRTFAHSAGDDARGTLLRGNALSGAAAEPYRLKRSPALLPLNEVAAGTAKRATRELLAASPTADETEEDRALVCSAAFGR